MNTRHRIAGLILGGLLGHEIWVEKRAAGRSGQVIVTQLKRMHHRARASLAICTGPVFGVGKTRRSSSRGRPNSRMSSMLNDVQVTR